MHPLNDPNRKWALATLLASQPGNHGPAWGWVTLIDVFLGRRPDVRKTLSELL